ncbi:unnamed protein product [Amoebophrya sp. A120]|nr:unnamed protein product [Amoebophrya sp. A120]|eukprot:GSA120T00017174001.1
MGMVLMFTTFLAAHLATWTSPQSCVGLVREATDDSPKVPPASSTYETYQGFLDGAAGDRFRDRLVPYLLPHADQDQGGDRRKAKSPPIDEAAFVHVSLMHSCRGNGEEKSCCNRKDDDENIEGSRKGANGSSRESTSTIFRVLVLGSGESELPWQFSEHAFECPAQPLSGRNPFSGDHHLVFEEDQLHAKEQRLLCLVDQKGGAEEVLVGEGAKSMMGVANEKCSAAASGGIDQHQLEQVDKVEQKRKSSPCSAPPVSIEVSTIEEREILVEQEDEPTRSLVPSREATMTGAPAAPATDSNSSINLLELDASTTPDATHSSRWRRLTRLRGDLFHMEVSPERQRDGREDDDISTGAGTLKDADDGGLESRSSVLHGSDKVLVSYRVDATEDQRAGTGKTSTGTTLTTTSSPSAIRGTNVVKHQFDLIVDKGVLELYPDGFTRYLSSTGFDLLKPGGLLVSIGPYAPLVLHDKEKDLEGGGANANGNGMRRDRGGSMMTMTREQDIDNYELVEKAEDHYHGSSAESSTDDEPDHQLRSEDNIVSMDSPRLFQPEWWLSDKNAPSNWVKNVTTFSAVSCGRAGRQAAAAAAAAANSSSSACSPQPHRTSKSQTIRSWRLLGTEIVPNSKKWVANPDRWFMYVLQKQWEGEAAKSFFAGGGAGAAAAVS